MPVAAQAYPTVDVNVFAYNAAASIGTAIENILAQSWPSIRITIIDNGSIDDTREIAARYVAEDPNIGLYNARANGGMIVNCQRAFSFGAADFVMPKTADDLIDPTFVEKAMAVLLSAPGCAMCHARGLVFAEEGTFKSVYPEIHALHAVGDNPVARAAHVMSRYTSAPSFWGVYRREMVDQLSRFRYRAGWDHVVLAELALYGEIRHVPDVLFLRRDGGKPVRQIARDCTEASQRNVSLSDMLAELRWMTPLITTTYAHIEAFAVVPLAASQRELLMRETHRIFSSRWGALFRNEAKYLLGALPELLERTTGVTGPLRGWMLQQIRDAVGAMELIVPKEPAALLSRQMYEHFQAHSLV